MFRTMHSSRPLVRVSHSVEAFSARRSTLHRDALSSSIERCPGSSLRLTTRTLAQGYWSERSRTAVVTFALRRLFLFVFVLCFSPPAVSARKISGSMPTINTRLCGCLHGCTGSATTGYARRYTSGVCSTTCSEKASALRTYPGRVP